MLNMRFGGSLNFCTENWGSCIFGYHKKTIIIIMILKKNFLGPPICVQHSEILRLLWGKLSH